MIMSISYNFPGLFQCRQLSILSQYTCLCVCINTSSFHVLLYSSLWDIVPSLLSLKLDNLQYLRIDIIHFCGFYVLRE